MPALSIMYSLNILPFSGETLLFFGVFVQAYLMASIVIGTSSSSYPSLVSLVRHVHVFLSLSQHLYYSEDVFIACTTHTTPLNDSLTDKLCRLSLNIFQIPQGFRSHRIHLFYLYGHVLHLRYLFTYLNYLCMSLICKLMSYLFHAYYIAFNTHHFNRYATLRIVDFYLRTFNRVVFISVYLQ